MASDGRSLAVAGAIGDVVTCRCTAEGMNAISPDGWGVGAGGIGRDGQDALERLVDATFLFSTVFVSPSPSGPGLSATAVQLEADGQRYFAPTMAWFTGGAPDHLYAEMPPMGQSQLLEEVLWPASPGRAAIGVLALVHLHGADVAGALIRTSVARDHEHVPMGRVTTDPELRDRYFDLEPLTRWPDFVDGLAWLVGVSICQEAEHGAPAAIRERMAAPPGDRPYLHHCHLVLVPDAPPSWRQPSDATWTERLAVATSSVRAQADDALAVHSDDATVMTPLTTAVWSFGRDEVRAWA